MCMDIGTGVDGVENDDDCHSASVEKHCNNSYVVMLFSSPFRYDTIRSNLSYPGNTSHGKNI